MSLKPNKQMFKRQFIVMLCLIIVFVSVSGIRLVDIMIVNGEKYQGMASEQQLYDSLVTAPRGDIYDCNMNVLATSTTAWTVYLTPNGISKIGDTEKKEKIKTLIADGLSEILELERDKVYEYTEKNTYYVTVKKKVDKSVADEVREFLTENADYNLSKYIGLEETTKRYYPNDNLASVVLGFVGNDNQGLSGIESYYDTKLTGVAGRVVSAKTAHGTDMPFTYEVVEEAVQGNSLVLTIDSYIQYVCEKQLAQAVESNKSNDRGLCVAMDVNTGEIKGLAVKGDFNPNDPFELSNYDKSKLNSVTDEDEKEKLESKLLNEQWRNKAVSDTSEPGSVFKIVTASIALEENLAELESTYNCSGIIQVAGQAYNCHKHSGHGLQTLTQAMSNSCNPAFITIGQKIGVSLFSKYFEAFGLTSKTGIDLPGEANSIYYSEEDMGPVELASASFGQTFKITPIQLLTSVSVAVNGGYLVKPHVLKKILDADGNVIETASTDYKRQIISESTSEKMRSILEAVISGGAKNGYVAGYRVGGKTGTSEKVSEMILENKKGLYVASYVGFAPMDNPSIAMLVMIDEPMGDSYYGSAVSAPVASASMAEILPYLGYEPQYSEEELKRLAISVPNVTTLSLADAKSKVTSAGLIYKVVGEGQTVINQLPSASEKLYSGGLVILYTDDGSSSQMTTVPDFTGKTVSEINTLAAESGINIELSGNTLSSAGTLSYSQTVAAGSEVAIGTIVTVYFRDSTIVDMAQ